MIAQIGGPHNLPDEGGWRLLRLDADARRDGGKEVQPFKFKGLA